MKIITLFLLMSMTYATTAQHSNESLNFLEGVWKMEDKEVYEVWNLIADNHLKGQSYKITYGIKQITETLEIKNTNNQFIYTATVVGQNDGKGIDFQLNKIDKDTYAFENPKHDFPQKIVYQKLNEEEVFVQVLGEGDKGSSYKMKRSEAPKTIPDWFMQDLKNNIGTWIADNKENLSEEDPYLAYGLEYKWGIGKTSIIGRLYGIKEGVETEDFWQFRQYWDNVKEKGVVVQYGNWGVVGFGYMKPISNNQMESIQTFSLTDGRTWEVKHIIEMHETNFISTSYDKDKNGTWINSGGWTWVKKN